MTESQIEQYALDILANLGWQTLHGPDIGPDGAVAERELRQVVLPGRLRNVLVRLNPHIPELALKEAMRRLMQISKPSLIEDNHDFHQLLVAGVPVQYRMSSGEVKHDIVRVVDFNSPRNNDFAAVNQLTVLQGDYNRRPDIVLFVNGLPLVVIELKNVADAKADLTAAYQQIQTYKREISDLFRFNELCVTSDGLEAEMGTITSPLERMMPWKTIDGEEEAGNIPALGVLLRGVCMPERLLDIVRNFIVFERSNGSKLVKIVAAYHQCWVVNKAFDSTLVASNKSGDRRAGVVWHTQGSGKSLSMVFYAGRLMKSNELHNPTVVVVTDRNDLDGQLFSTFSACSELLGEEPRQADSRSELRELLKREVGGIIFTTIQKFSPEDDRDHLPVLTDRRNVIVMADEAHRSQYGLKAHVRASDAQLVYGYAKYMRDVLPGASYIGFTGTPIETDDKSTPAMFGDYIDIYDVERAVRDGVTVPIYYESRLVNLDMDETIRQWLDKEVDDLLEGEELSRQGALKAE